MVGDVTARVAYGEPGGVRRSRRLGHARAVDAATIRSFDGRARGSTRADPESPDVIYGASFVTMTAPDQRVAFREGAFDARARSIRARAAIRRCPASPCWPPAVSPRRPRWRRCSAAGSRRRIRRPARCPRPPRRRSRSPRARRRTCRRSGATSAGTTAASATASRRPTRPTSRAASVACAHLPTFDTGRAGGSPASDLIQLVVSGRASDRCKGLTHYTLRGCFEDVNCAIPEWDFTANPPAWWPCGP